MREVLKFLNHTQISLEIISQRGLDKDYQEACKTDLEAEEKLTVATEAKENSEGMDEDPAVIKSWKKANSSKTRAGDAIESAIQAVLMQYPTQLLETTRYPWTTIIGEQIDCNPWMEVYGNEHSTKSPPSWTSFLECVQLHLQTVFRTDAVEQEWSISAMG